VTWARGPQLELLDSSGTLLLSLPPETNDPPAEFFRTSAITQ